MGTLWRVASLRALGGAGVGMFVEIIFYLGRINSSTNMSYLPKNECFLGKMYILVSIGAVVI